jgi:AcrR family transcriptional regulator
MSILYQTGLTVQFFRAILIPMERAKQKENRKTRYTKAALRDSLLELMQQKSLPHISLKEICELADVSRSTFYTYYNNQYDLLKHVEDEILEKIGALFGKAHAIQKTENADFVAIAEEMLRFMADNKNAMGVLFGQNSDERFKNKFVRYFIKQVINSGNVNLSKKNDLKKEMLPFYFIIGGIISVLSEWIQNNMSIPIPEFAKYLTKMAANVMK